jgi:hypothetical protein
MGIGMFKFEVVPVKGKGSGTGTEFWLPVETVVEIAEDIEDGVFSVNVQNVDAKGKPYYNYVAGTNGSRSMQLTAGNTGILLKISNKVNDSWVNQSVALSKFNGKSPLREFARLVGLFAGTWTPGPGTYYASVLEAYKAGEPKRYKPKAPEDSAEVVPDVPEAPVQATPAAAPAPAPKAAPAPAAPAAKVDEGWEPASEAVVPFLGGTGLPPVASASGWM